MQVILETRSKLRSLFEKNKDLVCIPTYPDNNDTLSKLTTIFFKKENILNFTTKYKYNCR